MDMNVYDAWLFAFTLAESMIIVLGNGFLLVTFGRHRKLLNAMNCYIFSMCLSGLVTGFLAPLGFGPHVGPYTVSVSNLTKCDCQKAKSGIFYMTACNSILCMLAIAVERWRALMPPPRGNRLMMNRRISSTRTSQVVVVLAWIASICYGVAYIVVNDVEEIPIQYVGSVTNACFTDNQTHCGDWNFTFCYLKSAAAKQRSRLYHLISLIAVFISPLVIISIIYIVLVARLLRNVKRTEEANSGSCSIHRAKLRAIQAMILVVVVFAMCWLPGQILIIWVITGNPPQAKPGAPFHTLPLGLRITSDAVVRLIVTHHWIQIFIYPRYSRQLANAIKETASYLCTSCTASFWRPCHRLDGNTPGTASSKGTTDSRKVSVNQIGSPGVSGDRSLERCITHL